MVLTHLCLFQFLGGASPAPLPSFTGFGGSNALPPFYLFDGFSPTGSPPVVVADQEYIRLRSFTERFY